MRDRPGRPDLRVIVVGRSSLDQALRRDGRVEFVRVGTPLEAIGELAAPLDAEVPERCAVLLCAADRPAHTEPFVAAVRLAHPRAAVLGVGAEWRGLPDQLATLDGVVDEHAGVEGLRRQLDCSGAEPHRVTVTPPAAFVEARATALTAAAAGWIPGDGPIVQALLTGQDIAPAALGVLAARLGLGPSGLTLVRGEATVGDGVIIEHAGRTLGVLRGTASAALEPHVRWLGDWLALADQHAGLRQAAMTDELTGAFNRRFFEQHLAASIEHAAKYRLSLTLMLFDIDNFKHFNDRYGHPAGDEILRETVRLLNTTIRPNDRVCRIGGDEFAVVFFEPTGPRDPGSKPPEDVAQIASRFQAQIAAHRFPKLGDCAPGTLTISAGLATYPWDGLTGAALMERADQIALEAKREGKRALRIGPRG